MADEVKIDGLDELFKAMQEMPVKLEKKVLRGAMRAGAKVFLDRARAKVPTKTGKLRKSLRISTRVRNGKIEARLIAGNKEAFYPHMVEFGTAAHFIKPKSRKSLFFAGLAREIVDHPGAKPQPFMRPAFDGGTTDAIEAARAYAARRIDEGALK